MTESPRRNLYNREYQISSFSSHLPIEITKSIHLHLADKPILIHGPSLLALCIPRCLSPHLLHVLEHHVAVPVEGLDSGEELAVVSTRDQDLVVCSHGGL